MTNETDFIAALSDLLGPSGVLRDAADMPRYTRDWAGHELGQPLAVARPATTEEVAAVVRLCHENGIAMVPQGGHTGLVGSAFPGLDDRELVISLERLNRIRDIDPINFSMTVEAGCVLEEIKRAAEEHDCDFPLSLGAQGSCQIGGNIATNAGGLNVLRHGMMRELVLGLEVVLPDGRVWNGLHSLHKDNRGYSLQQLFLGSEGTLGIVTGAVLKLAPRPDQTATALIGLPSVAAVVELYGLARRGCSDLLSAFELIPRRCLELAMEASPRLSDPMDDAYPWYVLMEVAATGPVDLGTMIEQLLENGMERGLVLDGVLASSGAQAEQLWQFRESMLEGQRMHGEHLRTDVSVPISSIAAFVERAETVVAEASPDSEVIAYGHVGDGNLHFNILPPRELSDADKATLLHDLEMRVFAVLDDFHGSISAEHGIGRTKQEAYLQRLPAVERELLQGIKRVFDPKGLMSTGRILPAEGDR
ncbi:FAD-binding oxidoreductase [Litchfieldella xinjiangensis]|uniref:FAD-binding oxidoreductase n=1 Tax=Litchfieldella xinjiangensis TaxID=1166948 RepID=UPI0005BE81F5|nr:FAD-binding oxidoreductase [Halomonas xinjiangensis]